MLCCRHFTIPFMAIQYNIVIKVQFYLQTISIRKALKHVYQIKIDSNTLHKVGHYKCRP